MEYRYGQDQGQAFRRVRGGHAARRGPRGCRVGELTLELGCAKTKLRVGGVDGDEDEVEAAMANAEAKPISVSIGGAIAPPAARSRPSP